MAAITLSNELSIEQLDELVRSQLGEAIEIIRKNNRLRIKESSWSGCNVTLKNRKGINRCYIFGFMPSVLARLGLLFGIFGVFSLISTLAFGEFNVVAGGIIPFFIFFILLSLPSKKLVKRVTQIIEDHESDQNSTNSTAALEL